LLAEDSRVTSELELVSLSLAATVEAVVRLALCCDAREREARARRLPREDRTSGT
jgi:hypothetical protein